VQFLLEVERDERAGPHPVDVDPAGIGHGVDDAAEDRGVELGGSLLDSARISERHLLDHLPQSVAGVDVAAHYPLASDALGAPGLGGEPEP